MSGLPKLNMAAVDDAAAKKKAKKKDKKTVKDRVDRGRALVRQASASLKRGLTPRGTRASEVSHEERSGSESGADDYPALTGALGPRDSISALSDSDAESSEGAPYAAAAEASPAGGSGLDEDLKDQVSQSLGEADPGQQGDLNATHDKPPSPDAAPAAVSAPDEGSYAAADASVADDVEPETDSKNRTSLQPGKADSEQQRTLKPAEDAAPAMEKRYQEISPAPVTPADPGAAAGQGEEGGPVTPSPERPPPPPRDSSPAAGLPPRSPHSRLPGDSVRHGSGGSDGGGSSFARVDSGGQPRSPAPAPEASAPAPSAARLFGTAGQPDRSRSLAPGGGGGGYPSGPASALSLGPQPSTLFASPGGGGSGGGGGGAATDVSSPKVAPELNIGRRGPFNGALSSSHPAPAGPGGAAGEQAPPAPFTPGFEPSGSPGAGGSTPPPAGSLEAEVSGGRDSDEVAGGYLAAADAVAKQASGMGASLAASGSLAPGSGSSASSGLPGAFSSELGGHVEPPPSAFSAPGAQARSGGSTGAAPADGGRPAVERSVGDSGSLVEAGSAAPEPAGKPAIEGSIDKSGGLGEAGSAGSAPGSKLPIQGSIDKSGGLVAEEDQLPGATIARSAEVPFANVGGAGAQKSGGSGAGSGQRQEEIQAADSVSDTTSEDSSKGSSLGTSDMSQGGTPEQAAARAKKASADGSRSKWRNLAIAVALFAVGAVATEPALNALRKPKEPNAPLAGQEMAHKGRTWGFR